MVVAVQTERRGSTQLLLLDDADGARMTRTGSLEAPHCVNERPVTIEHGTRVAPDDGLEDRPDAGVPGRFTNERSDARLIERAQPLPVILAVGHDETSEVEDVVLIEVADTELGRAATEVAADHEWFAGHIEYANELDRVSHVRAVLERRRSGAMTRG